MKPTLDIFSTKEWGADPILRKFELHRPLGIIVHHTAGPNRVPESGESEKKEAFILARGIQSHHIDSNGWADSGQNFTISRGGVVLEGRTTSLRHAEAGFVTRGAHAGDDDGNRFFFGIEVEGNNEAAFKVTDVQWASLVELCAWLSAAGGFQSSNLRGHKEFVANVCPGKLQQELPRLRKEVRARKIEILDMLGEGV